MTSNESEQNETKRHGETSIFDATEIDTVVNLPPDYLDSGREKRVLINTITEAVPECESVVTFGVWHDEDERSHGLMDVQRRKNSPYRISEAKVVLVTNGRERARLEDGETWQSWYKSQRAEKPRSRWTKCVTTDVLRETASDVQNVRGEFTLRIEDTNTGHTEYSAHRKRIDVTR